jgi:hypothetical protein
MGCEMKRIIRTLFLVSLFVLGASSVFAQGYPHWHHHGMRYRGGHVLGPAYGWPGEPLGPAYWNSWSWPGNPRTCGPGACQDNPLY